MTHEDKRKYYYTEDAICTVKGFPYRYSIEVVHGSDVHSHYSYNVNFSGVLHLGEQSIDITIVRGLGGESFLESRFGIKGDTPNRFVRQIIEKYGIAHKSNQINK